jgi:hypothetical protein
VQPNSNLYLERVAVRSVVPKTTVRAVLEVESGPVDAADRVAVEAKEDPAAVQNKGTYGPGLDHEDVSSMCIFSFVSLVNGS